MLYEKSEFKKYADLGNKKGFISGRVSIDGETLIPDCVRTVRNCWLGQDKEKQICAFGFVSIHGEMYEVVKPSLSQVWLIN